MKNAKIAETLWPLEDEDPCLIEDVLAEMDPQAARAVVAQSRERGYLDFDEAGGRCGCGNRKGELRF